MYLLVVFRVYDKDRDGKISKEDLTKVRAKFSVHVLIRLNIRVH